ncbi:U6 snRNA phosphodiesterase [Plakobranchus ocellatus]|uniref:U6 snRNA phosphodiesterase n=1 Tax=Plakobranchus ocellatus TaxID=259542 RepID=A0AAV3Z3H1_9GAST|nr:U6 snRNA phosphodiesterase [Plakobranchus ocellatus]
MNGLVAYSESSDEEDQSTCRTSSCADEKSFARDCVKETCNRLYSDLTSVKCGADEQSSFVFESPGKKSSTGGASDCDASSESYTKPEKGHTTHTPYRNCEDWLSDLIVNNNVSKNTSALGDSSSQKHLGQAAKRSIPGIIQTQDGSELQTKKRKVNGSGVSEGKKLELPVSIQSMYKNSQCVPVDNPALHQNRVRSFPHEQGNWATHVYIPVFHNEHLSRLVLDMTQIFLPLRFEVHPEFHISLSQTVVIRHHWIEPLVESLRDQLQHIPTSICEMADVKLFTNDEKTRTFLCIELSDDDTELLQYVKVVDNCFKDFKLAPYYENPSFHISVGWCLGDVTNAVSREQLSKAKKLLSDFLAVYPDLSMVYAHQICCRSGNKLAVIQLKESSNVTE